MDALTPIRQAKNQAYADYFKKWLAVEKAKHSATPPSEEMLEEVRRHYEYYQGIIELYQFKLQENNNVTSSDYGNG
jgi:hypothetical protein